MSSRSNKLNLTSGTFWRAASVLNGFWLLVTCYRIPRPPPKCDCGCVIKWRVAALVLFCCGLKSFKNCLPFRGKAWNFYFSLCSLPSHFCFVILEGFFHSFVIICCTTLPWFHIYLHPFTLYSARGPSTPRPPPHSWCPVLFGCFFHLLSLFPSSWSGTSCYGSSSPSS